MVGRLLERIVWILCKVEFNTGVQVSFNIEIDVT